MPPFRPGALVLRVPLLLSICQAAAGCGAGGGRSINICTCLFSRTQRAAAISGADLRGGSVQRMPGIGADEMGETSSPSRDRPPGADASDQHSADIPVAWIM